MKILFTGGGTGGHILPLIAVAREVRRVQGTNKIRFAYLGPKDNFSRILLSQEGIEVQTILAGKLRRYLNATSILRNIVDILFMFPVGLLQSFGKVFTFSPDLIVSKGGYGALAPAIAGWIMQVPIFLHESDASPGLANKIAGKFATRIFTSFENTENFPKKKITVIGNPIRKEVLSGSKQEAKRIFKLQGGKPVILISGGSQGAQKINDTLLNILNETLKEFEIIHQTGEKNFKQIKAEAKVVIEKGREIYYHAVPFLKERELRHAYAVSEIIVNRAGSGSIFEIAALGKPSIIIPLTNSAQNHQIKNAYAYEKTGACIVLEEANLTPNFFLEKLRRFISHKKDTDKMKAAALAFSKPEAANVLARLIIEYLKG
ncbi:MAG: UDP-N-acetylglucosamine--N-acetylmuramyl-(pentapeptide) pyrophosphoryl-undecaprenol N-acetylglucosamine transferase [Patescibacteria group bacterium]|nr:UDP-N-acetylglucosamine--N-acetylmuramyl-(pentapeptide) pyrophosphoryl-undecaprenol N-acetylglucosamine transferase [Patescibacteria group bacterium]